MDASRSLLGLDSMEHADLEKWARLFGGTAILGFISTLLIAGKWLHHVSQRRGLVFGFFVAPPVIVGGLLGLIWFSAMEVVDPLMTTALRNGLEAITNNLVNFVFAALILGLTCSRSNSQHSNSFRGIATSLIHEGMPMVIYSQILQWGQSTCCMFAFYVFRMMHANVPPLFPAMIPVGLEAGTDMNISWSFKSYWSEDVVEEAESLGLLAVIIFGITMFSSKSYLVSKGWLGPTYSRDTNNIYSQGAGQAEAFEKLKVVPGASISSKLKKSSSTGEISPELQKSATGDEEFGYNADKNYEKRVGTGVTFASLGSHLSLIALTVFLSFALSLLCHLLEIEVGIEHHFLSGIRMFKLSMCCAMMSMIFLLQRTRMRFNREWFMRLCGLMLDLLVISALSKAYPKPLALEKTTHYVLVSFFVFVCLLWNLFCFMFVAPMLFPNYWFERALTLTGDAMGHSYTGLLFARTLDPTMESPVPAAFAYKLMLFFIPSSGAKNTIVASFILQHGIEVAFIICICVLATWLGIVDMHFNHRPIGPIKNSKSDLADGDVEGAGNGGSDFTDRQPLLTGPPPRNDSQPSLAAMAGGGNSSVSSGVKGAIDTPALSIRGRSEKVWLDSDPLRRTMVTSSEPSSIVSKDEMNSIASWLTESRSQCQWKLTYSLRQHGANLESLLHNSAIDPRHRSHADSPCVIIIEDSWGYIFGGYISPSIQSRKDYYGSGESFIFSIKPVPQCYKWTGQNELFVLSNEQIFAMGGGGDGFAIQLDDELDTGVSNRSATFNNNTLSSSEFFKCLNVEVWMLDHLAFN